MGTCTRCLGAVFKFILERQKGDLVVGISKERPFHRKACFSYRREKPLEDSLAWIEKILNG